MDLENVRPSWIRIWAFRGVPGLPQEITEREKERLVFCYISFTLRNVSDMCSSLGLYSLLLLFLHQPTQSPPSWSSPATFFISNFDRHTLSSESPLVSVWLPEMVLFIKVSSLPWALKALWALPSRNDQMWPGPWSLCQPRTGGQPLVLVGIPHTREKVRLSEARERGGGGIVWRGCSVCVSDGVLRTQA